MVKEETETCLSLNCHPQHGQPCLVKEVIFRWEHRDPFGALLVKGEHLADIVPNAGLSWMSANLFGTNTGAGTNVVLGTSSTAVTMGDLNLGGEITTFGLARQAGSTSGVGAVQGTSSGGNTAQATGACYIYTTFTASASVTVNEAGLSPNAAANAGIIAHDILSPAATMGAGDTLTPSWQFIL